MVAALITEAQLHLLEVWEVFGYCLHLILEHAVAAVQAAEVQPMYAAVAQIPELGACERHSRC